MPGKVEDSVTLAKLVEGNEALYYLDSLKTVLFGGQQTYTNTIFVQLNDLRAEELESYSLNATTLDQSMANIVKRHEALIAQQEIMLIRKQCGVMPK